MSAKSPLRAIREFCKECQDGSFQAAAACNDSGCPFYLYRDGKPLPRGKHKPTSTIKQYCHEYCQAGAGREEVKNCQGDKALLGACPIYAFRLGRNPNIRDETRAKHRAISKERVASHGLPFQNLPVKPRNEFPRIDDN